MNVADIFNYARLKAYVDVLQYPNATLLPFLNIRYHELENVLTTLKEDFFYDVLTGDTVADQNRYSLKLSSATTEGVKKVINTYIKWASDDVYFSKLALGNTDNDVRSLDKLAGETNKDSGFYVMKGTEIIIYPTPFNSVTNGLQQEVIVNLKDLAVDSTESAIFATTVDDHSELRQYHYLIGLGVASDIFGLRGMFGEKAQMDNEYNIAKENMLRQISDRFTTPIEQKLLNVSNFK